MIRKNYTQLFKNGSNIYYKIHAIYLWIYNKYHATQIKYQRKVQNILCNIKGSTRVYPLFRFSLKAMINYKFIKNYVHVI